MSQGNILMDFPTEYMRVFNLHSMACFGERFSGNSL